MPEEMVLTLKERKERENRMKENSEVIPGNNA